MREYENKVLEVFANEFKYDSLESKKHIRNPLLNYS